MFFTVFANAQETEPITSTEKKSEFWDKVSLGGSLGLGFGNGYTNILVAPGAIYKFNNYIAGGTALSFNYTQRKNDFQATVLGGSIMALFKPFEEILLSAEFEQNHVDFNDKIANADRTYWYPALYLGGGYTVGNFGAIGVRYDVLYNERKSINASAFMPFIRVFF